MIRMMYIMPAEGFGGAERQGVLHIKNLPNYGISVIPVVGPGRIIINVLEEYGVTDSIYFSQMPREYNTPFKIYAFVNYILNTVNSWHYMYNNLKKFAIEKRVDLIFANRVAGWLLAGPLSKRLNIPCIWRGGSRSNSAVKSLALRILCKFYAPDAFISNCKAVEKSLISLVNSPGFIVYNGVDLDKFNPDKVRPRIRSEMNLNHTNIVGIAARPAPGKGLDLLAEIVKKLTFRNSDIKFLIAGDYGWKAHYQNYFRSFDLDGRVSFLGYIQDIETFYKSCDVVILTSHERSIEGLPNSLLEAMAMECPVISTNVSGIKEIIKHGENGFLVPDGDSFKLAKYLNILFSNDNLRREMGKMGRKTIIERFSENESMEKLVQVINKVVHSTLKGRSRTNEIF